MLMVPGRVYEFQIICSRKLRLMRENQMYYVKTDGRVYLNWSNFMFRTPYEERVHKTKKKEKLELHELT